MNNKQITRFNANDRASSFLDKHDSELSGIPLYAEIKAAFDDEMLKINKALVKQAKQIAPITQHKKRLRLFMADTMIRFIGRAAVQCHNDGNLGLEQGIQYGKNLFHPLQGRRSCCESQ
jgi:hypothetical protein